MSNKLRRVLMIVCAVVLVYSVFQLGLYFMTYQKGESIYKQARAYRVSTQPSQEEDEERIESVDFDGLKTINPDVFGWLHIPGIVVDYPLLLTQDDDYYLDHTYDNQTSDFGSIFLEQKNASNLSDTHSILYGRNMKNKMMFGALLDFHKQSFVDKHNKIVIYVPDGQLEYEVFSAYTTSGLDSTYKISFENKSEVEEMLQGMKDSSVISAEKMPTSEDQILTLSTYTMSGSKKHHFVVHAVLVHDSRM